MEVKVPPLTPIDISALEKTVSDLSEDVSSLASDVSRLEESVAYFIQGRTPKSVGAKHYMVLVRQAKQYYPRYAEYLDELSNGQALISKRFVSREKITIPSFSI